MALACGCGKENSSSDSAENEKEQVISFWKSSDATDGWYEEKFQNLIKKMQEI